MKMKVRCTEILENDDYDEFNDAQKSSFNVKFNAYEYDSDNKLKVGIHLNLSNLTKKDNKFKVGKEYTLEIK